MAAYAAVISLKHTIQHYILHPNSHIPVVPSSRDIIQFVDDELTSVQADLRRLDGRRRSSRRLMEALDGQIRDAVYQLEDLIESHVSDQIHSQSEEEELLVSFEEARQEINSLIQEVKKTREKYTTELDNQEEEEEEEEDEDAVSSGVDFDHGDKNFMTLSLSNFKRNIAHHLSDRMPCGLGVVSIVGEEGTGRTMLANAAFNHKDATCCDRRAWVSVGPRYEVKEIIISLLSQIDPDHDEGELWDDEKLGEQLYTSLKGRKYLISLHNVCDAHVWDHLRSSFPDDKNGSRVLITTSLEEVARFANSFRIYTLDFLNEEQCWSAISMLVFFFMPCPTELEEAGKKIAQNCQGLPLEIFKVALLLLGGDETPEYWNAIAEYQIQNCVSKDAYDEMSEISQSKEGLQWENFPFEALKLEDIHDDIMRSLFLDNWSEKPKKISIFGMAGIGKTTLAKEVFEDPSTLRHFDHRVWVTLGPKYRYERILVDILAQIDPNIDKMSMRGDEILAKNICTILSSKTCLIVLDDVWDKDPLCNLLELLKDVKFEVLLTTRLGEVTHMASTCHMRLLNNEESWRLFCEKVFGEKSCPAELEKPGRLIVENCEGLPLMIVTIASLLFQAEKTPKFWNKVARKENSVFKDAYDKIYNTLLPSYEYLPQHLKPFFLYMGVFPLKYEICNSKLLSLWDSEGILELEFSEYLEKLHSSSLLIVHYNRKIKTSRLHSVFWHLCVKKARNIKFFHVLNKIIDGSAEDIDGQRRLCIHNNILFGIKDVHTSMTSNSTVRSLLCTGSNHQYQVPVCFSFMLLRIFDALTIRFYEFPVEAFELVLLRYLALTCNGMLPASISKLCSLQYLIVGRHLSIKLLYEAPVYLPMEIWDMKQLKHLQVLGGDLPDPCGAVLPNLLILLDVSPHSCTESVFLGTPSLQKLGVRIELAPNASESLFKFDHISCLHRLETLKCVVVNPEFRAEVAPPLSSGSLFLSGIKKLSLSGLGYPWEYMSVIGELENLKILKLRCYAFRGPEWIIHDGEFEKLEYLLIEDTDLVNWSADSDNSISGLCHLIIRHCYKLRDIHYRIRHKYLLNSIEFVDCHPSASNLQFPNFRSSPGPFAEVHSSWE